jgi:hypothetical protein
VKFGTPKRLARDRAIGRFTLRGTLRGAPGPVDPGKDGVAFSLATPQSELMAVVARKLVMKGGGWRLVGRSTEGGLVSVTLTQIGSGYRFTAKGRRLDLSVLAPDAGDPRSRDLTIAFEMSGASFVRNCNLVLNEGVFEFPWGEGEGDARFAARLAPVDASRPIVLSGTGGKHTFR